MEDEEEKEGEHGGATTHRDGCSFLQPEQHALILPRIIILNHEAFVEYGNVDIRLLMHSMVIIK